jgi:hypothetical protein
MIKVVCKNCNMEFYSKIHNAKYCENCRKNYQKIYKELNKERIKKRDKLYRDNHKEQYNEWIRENLERKKYIDKLNYKKNRDKIKKQVSQYKKTSQGKNSIFKCRNRRRAFKNNIIELFTIEEWKLIKKSINGICPKCKKKRKITLDHIYPISVANRDYITQLFNQNYEAFPRIYNKEDIQALCLNCNSHKKNKIPKGLKIKT